MKHQVIRLEIWNKLFIVGFLGFCYPDLLELAQILKEILCVLCQLCVNKLPLSVTERSAWQFLHVRLILGYHERDLLVVKPVHVTRFSLRPKRQQQEGKMEITEDGSAKITRMISSPAVIKSLP